MIEEILIKSGNLLFYWSSFALGAFLNIQITDYLKSKPLGTLLDGCYIQLFESWLLMDFFANLVVSIAELELQYYALTIFGWALYSSGILAAHLMIFGFGYRYLLIKRPGFFDDFEVTDEGILAGT